MKRIIISAISIFCLLLIFTSCSKTVILNSAEAKAMMDEKGYSTTITIHVAEEAAKFKVEQITIFYASKGDDFIQVYYFTNEEDTEQFYKDRAASIGASVDVVRKNKYSVYRGTEQAVADFLGK